MPSPIDIESRDLAPHTHNSETLSTNLWRNRGAASAAPGRSLWPETAMLSVAALIKSGQSDVIAKICYLQVVETGPRILAEGGVYPTGSRDTGYPDDAPG
jgi:hypothetical protein